MAHIAYYRVSTEGQSIDAQRAAIASSCQIDREFIDEAVSGATMALKRPSFGHMMNYVREGDTIHVYALDRLGRDALDVQHVVRDLIDRNVKIDIIGLGVIAKGIGELIVAVLAQIADMERNRIKERCDSGRTAAKQSLEKTGLTHKGKQSLGRPFSQDKNIVKQWRIDNKASIKDTAIHFNISKATVSRYCK